jgi:predicted adenylyl cyclase CyaB
MTHNDKIITTKEASELLKVHWQTVRNYIKDGKIKAVKVGKSVRILESEVLNIIHDRPKADAKEVEIRFVIKKRIEIEKKLLSLGAKITYHGHVIDHWYVPSTIKDVDEQNDWYDSGVGHGLRVREQDNGYTGKIATTVEIKKLATPHDHSTCIEQEVVTSDFREADRFLRLLDQKEMVCVDKERLVYSYKDYKIVIDDIKGYKTVLEIEKMSENPSQQIIDELCELADILGVDVKKDRSDKSITFDYIQEYSKF